MKTQKPNPAGWYINEIRHNSQGAFAHNILISTDPDRDINSLPSFTYWWEEGALTREGAISNDQLNFYTQIIKP
jgi:hypothetical protein